MSDQYVPVGSSIDPIVKDLTRRATRIIKGKDVPNSSHTHYAYFEGDKRIASIWQRDTTGYFHISTQDALVHADRTGRVTYSCLKDKTGFIDNIFNLLEGDRWNEAEKQFAEYRPAFYKEEGFFERIFNWIDRKLSGQ